VNIQKAPLSSIFALTIPLFSKNTGALPQKNTPRWGAIELFEGLLWGEILGLDGWKCNKKGAFVVNIVKTMNKIV
jgi:hypothetical protein